MKIVILSVLVSVALGIPVPQEFELNPNGRFAVIRSESNGPVEADFSWLFDGSHGQSNHDGAFSFTHDDGGVGDGTLTEVQYIINEGNNVKVLPHILQSIDTASTVEVNEAREKLLEKLMQ